MVVRDKADLAEGAIAVVGHPANGRTARLDSFGGWIETAYPHRVVSEDDMRGARVIYNPGDWES